MWYNFTRHVSRFSENTRPRNNDTHPFVPPGPQNRQREYSLKPARGDATPGPVVTPRGDGCALALIRGAPPINCGRGTVGHVSTLVVYTDTAGTLGLGHVRGLSVHCTRHD